MNFVSGSKPIRSMLLNDVIKWTTKSFASIVDITVVVADIKTVDISVYLFQERWQVKVFKQQNYCLHFLAYLRWKVKLAQVGRWSVCHREQFHKSAYQKCLWNRIKWRWLRGKENSSRFVSKRYTVTSQNGVDIIPMVCKGGRRPWASK